MGFAANQARLLALISRRSDLELQAQFVSQHRMYLANIINGFFNQQSKLEPETPEYKYFEDQISRLQHADKMLEMQINRVNSQRDAVVKEIEGTQEVIKKNIDSSFGLLGKR